MHICRNQYFSDLPQSDELTKLSCVLMVALWRKWYAEAEEGNAGDTLACTDDAHNDDVYTQSHLFYEIMSY